ncbi:pentapeptide repeat-containing protein [Methylococcus mesophilus]|uniref:pentapeptide repeat-containing protein n=1 Tax=Methylococcus mesophilus TaxID=2993564 RepID=UPI0029393AA1|nr:pentapeptide repeat-containing protein [Methylococcus mesophilus]
MDHADDLRVFQLAIGDCHEFVRGYGRRYMLNNPTITLQQRFLAGIIKLGMCLLLSIAAEAHAASVTVTNYGWFVASFALKGCDKELNAGDIPVEQYRTFDLDELGCSKEQTARLEIYYNWWGWKTLDFPPVVELRWVGGGVWRVMNKQSWAMATQGNILIRLDGPAWAPEASLIDFKKDLWKANLPGADLAGVDLSMGNLESANLPRADLSGAILRRADLSRANLSSADLSSANLYGADLNGADLSGAKGANLAAAITTGSTICPNKKHGPCR